MASTSVEAILQNETRTNMDIFSLRSKTVPAPHCDFAVAVSFVKKADDWYLLYEVRSAALRRQACEVCFPGGKREEGEDAVECALRELKEEVNLSPLEVLGPLPFITKSRGKIVCPVGVILPDREIAANPAEVADVFTVPLIDLCRREPTCYSKEHFPCHLVGIPENYAWWNEYDTVPLYEGLPYPVWGLTARITQQTISLLKNRNE